MKSISITGFCKLVGKTEEEIKGGRGSKLMRVPVDHKSWLPEIIMDTAVELHPTPPEHIPASFFADTKVNYPQAKMCQERIEVIDLYKNDKSSEQ